MKIATFNIQNRYLQNNNLTDDEYLQELRKFINSNKIDIIGLQELVYKFKTNLEKDYNLLDKGRFRLLFKKTKYNEYNSILTNYKIINSKTFYLPFSYSFIPRIVTTITIKNNNKKIRIINTHMCLYKYHKIKIKEINKLLKIIKKENIPTIIMGDFNLRENAYELKYLEEELNKIGIKKVNNKEKTFNKSILDFIFVSKSFLVKNTKVIETGISDHRALITNVYI